MSHTLFISDLHLSAGHERSMAAFLRFIDTLAPQAETLYILGDLFEYWAGDDDIHDPFHAQIIDVLHDLATQGTNIYLMHGNRDLLMGDTLALACHAALLPDPTMLDLYGTPTLITHGDKLCTDDVEYQKFRAYVHSEEFQKEFLARPLAARKVFIENLRQQSTAAKQGKDSAIMDVNIEAVLALLREHNYPRLIHGHTHRPARHLHHLDEHNCERWVLSDWDHQPAALQCDAQGCRSVNF